MTRSSILSLFQWIHNNPLDLKSLTVVHHHTHLSDCKLRTLPREVRLGSRPLRQQKSRPTCASVRKASTLLSVMQTFRDEKQLLHCFINYYYQLLRSLERLSELISFPPTFALLSTQVIYSVISDFFCLRLFQSKGQTYCRHVGRFSLLSRRCPPLFPTLFMHSNKV